VLISLAVVGLVWLVAAEPNHTAIRFTPAPAQHTPSGGGIATYQPHLDANGDPARVAFPQVDARPASATLPRALLATPDGTDVVDPDTARTIVATAWEVRRDLIAARSSRALAQFETGSALAVDTGRGCTCHRADHFGPASNVTVSVAHQHAYPAWFFAQLSTTLNGIPWNALLVMTRVRADDPWRIAFAGGGQPRAGADSSFPLAHDDDGFAPTTDIPGPPIASILADYWQRVKDTADTTLPSTLLPATLTDAWAKQIVVNRQGAVNAANGLSTYYLFYADSTPDFVVPLADGTRLQCSAIVEQETYVGRAGTGVVQTESRNAWTENVAPGRYGAIVEISEYTPCFQYRPGVPQFQANGVTPPDDVRFMGLD
jgi:hypothetical protein